DCSVAGGGGEDRVGLLGGETGEDMGEIVGGQVGWSRGDLTDAVAEVGYAPACGVETVPLSNVEIEQFDRQGDGGWRVEWLWGTSDEAIENDP
ncbi:hypothetical protein M2T30_28665, partial [Escherichia coli]